MRVALDKPVRKPDPCGPLRAVFQVPHVFKLEPLKLLHDPNLVYFSRPTCQECQTPPHGEQPPCSNHAASSHRAFAGGWALCSGCLHPPPPCPQPAWFIVLSLEGIVLMAHAPDNLLGLPAPLVGLCIPVAITTPTPTPTRAWFFLSFATLV